MPPAGEGSGQEARPESSPRIRAAFRAIWPRRCSVANRRPAEPTFPPQKEVRGAQEASRSGKRRLDERERNAFERSGRRPSNARINPSHGSESLIPSRILMVSFVVFVWLVAGRRKQADIVGSEDVTGGGAVGGEKRRE